ncbi:lambda exonuclease family protein [Williamsia serinedens]|uniref:YqaJ-like recombinase domain-containing protein n=1 Tax=Williamsia serinedens TaxID=391736 RepID=A0ABT1H6X6_9NOCA|nr:lambda exonuclease family protein [Williamsia serinedens]MCP2162684.1 YqaJ-like recombinase domain-containing protein [Williamsia serinedens]
MTLTTHPELIQGSDEWLEQRLGLVTASVVGQLITERELTAREYDCPACGAARGTPCISKVKAGSELKTMHAERAELARETAAVVLEPATGDVAQGLALTLAAERIYGFSYPTRMTDDMWRGVEDEPRARDKYAEHHGVTVDQVGFMTEDKWGFTLGYSPDGLVGDDGLIEIKSRRPKKQLETVLTGEVPAENYAQLQTGLLVSGREWIDYVSYAGGTHMLTTRVYPDRVWQRVIVEAIRLAENRIRDIVSRYTDVVDAMGYPLTERILEQEIQFS